MEEKSFVFFKRKIFYHFVQKLNFVVEKNNLILHRNNIWISMRQNYLIISAARKINWLFERKKVKYSFGKVLIFMRQNSNFRAEKIIDFSRGRKYFIILLFKKRSWIWLYIGFPWAVKKMQPFFQKTEKVVRGWVINAAPG